MPGMSDLEGHGDALNDSGFLRKVAELVPANIFVFNLQTGASEFNSATVATLIGYDNKDIVEMGDALLPTLLHPDDMKVAMDDMANAASLEGDQFSVPVEYRMRSKSGDWIWFASTMRVFDRDASGNVRRVVGAAHQISRQKAAEQDLQNSNRLLTSIVDAVPSGVLGVSPDGALVTANNIARTILGLGEIELPIELSELPPLFDEDMEPISDNQQPIARIRRGERIRAERYRFVRNDGDVRDLKFTATDTRSDTSAIQQVIVIDDVTDQERQRQILDRSSRLDALGQLTGGIAHDFNNLLATIRYALQLITREPLSAMQREYQEAALQAVKGGADLTKQLLAFGEQQPRLDRARSVSEAIKNTMKLARPLIEASIDIKSVAPDDDIMTYCDPVNLDNSLLNLVLNARDAILHSGKGDTITLFARSVPSLDSDTTHQLEASGSFVTKRLAEEVSSDQKRGDGASHRFVEIGVSDNGPGMPEHVRLKAVDPFFTTKERGRGTGLGLSMVYGFIQQSNGEMRIYSEEGQGTTVRMLIPRAAEGGGREEPVPSADLDRGAGQSILLVEDNDLLLEMMDDLVSDLGYRTETARSADAALKLLSDGGEFDLIITDIVMPGGIDGFQLADKVQTLCPKTRLIFVSGYTGYSEKEMSGVKGPLIQKPCEPDELALTIRATLAGEG